MRNLLGCLPLSWPLTTEHLEQHDSDGIDVTTRVDLVRGIGLLRRHVFWRAHDSTRLGQDQLIPLLVSQLGDAEIEDL